MSQMTGGSATLSTEYSAGLMSQSFWFIEIKKMIPLVCDGISEDDLKKECLENNLLGASKEYRAKRMYGYLMTRIHAMDERLLDLFCDSDLQTQKLINIIALMKTDRLFFEFVYELYREKVILGSGELSKQDVNVFFTNKERENEDILSWKDTTKSKLGRCFLNFLTEANMLQDENKTKIITVPIIDTRLQLYLESSGDTAILKAITGVA